MRNSFLFIGLSLLSLAAQAQYTSRLGRFQVDQVRGCAPFTITITNTNLITTGECTPGKPCLMDYQGNNNQQQNLFTFTYTTPGTYKLSVLYQSIGVDDIIVTVDQNIAPVFDIFACAGSKVSINITDKTYDSYDIDFNNNGSIDTSIPSGNNQVASFSYGAPGNYNISVKGKKLNAANNCNAKVQTFTAITVLPLPSISTLTATDATTLQLGFTPQTYIEYHAEIAFNNSNNFQQYQTLYGVNSMTASNLTVDKSYYCFRLSSFDPCANANTYSSPVCSHDFDLTVASGVDKLTWQTSSLGISTIQINRNNTTLASVSGSTSSYNDASIICKTNYCYQLVSKYAGGATSTSLQKCGTSFTTATPSSINNTSGVISNNNSQVDLVWLQDPVFTAVRFDIFRSQNNAYVFLDSAKVKQYSDASYQEGYCYKINYIDFCGNHSAEGLPSCPILLHSSLGEINDVILEWTGYKGWVKGVKNYTIQKYNQQGQLLQTFNAGTDSTYTDNQQDAINQVLFYKITATAIEAGVSVSISNEIRVVKNINLFYPTAFNPESKASQVNRVFTVRGHYIATMQLQVYDRWGSMVFFSDKNEPWDGRRDGVNMPDATYVWTAQGTDLNGSTFKNGGTVVLIRK